MKKITTLCFIAILGMLTMNAQMRITKNGKATTKIVCANNSKNTKDAAKILNRFVKEISGAELKIEILDNSSNLYLNGKEIKRRKTTKPGKGVISIGEISNKVGEDGFEIICKDGNLTIKNGIGRGAVYGVCELLEKYIGMDYLSYETYNVPKIKTIELPKINDLQTPAFEFRQTFNYANKDQLFKDFRRLEDVHDIFTANLWVHTFNRILPSSVYGKAHPEYYSFIRGKHRPGDHSQWCLTNPEVFDEVCKNLDKIFAENPDKQMIAVSQNDGNDTYCTCPECSKVDEYEGAHSGSLIRFLNKLATKYPDKKFITLAYLYTMHPPKYVKPLPNVYIMLCDIDVKREVALTDNASGQDFMKALRGWAAITNNIFIWDYCINFDNMVEPFPNLHILQKNIQLFKKYHASMLFEQSSNTVGTDMAELRTYLISKLMWEPNADVDALTKHFLKAYYKDAAPYIYKYLNILHGALLGSQKELWIYDSPITHKYGMFNKHLMPIYKNLFDKAEEAVAKDKDALYRVRLSRLPIMYSELEIARTENLEQNDIPALLKKLKLFRARCKEYSIKTLNERSNSPLDYCDLYLERYIPSDKPNFARGCPVQFILPPSDRYKKLGETALTDGLYGGTTFVESWVGWEGIDGEFVIDLGQERDVHYVSSDFLHQLGQWILLPKTVTYSLSIDGNEFKEFGKVDFPEDRDVQVKFVPATIEHSIGTTARYVKVRVDGIGICPTWHYGVGYPAWFFIDEVIVR